MAARRYRRVPRTICSRRENVLWGTEEWSSCSCSLTSCPVVSVPVTLVILVAGIFPWSAFFTFEPRNIRKGKLVLPLLRLKNALKSFKTTKSRKIKPPDRILSPSVPKTSGNCCKLWNYEIETLLRSCKKLQARKLTSTFRSSLYARTLYGTHFFIFSLNVQYVRKYAADAG